MASLLAYYLAALYIPSGVIGFIYIISAIVILLLRCFFRDRMKDDTFRLPLVFHVLISFSIRGLHMKESATQTGKYEVQLHGRKMRRFSAVMMLYIVSFTFILAMATLWSTLLIETSTTCGQEGFDCFANGTRVTDCDAFESGTNGNITSTDDQLECYRFVFNYIASFTSAGGVTFFHSIVVNTLILIMISISEIPNSCCRYAIFTSFSIFLAVLPLGFMFFNLYFPLFDDLLSPDILTLWVYFTTFNFSIFACLIVGRDLQIRNITQYQELIHHRNEHFFSV